MHKVYMRSWKRTPILRFFLMMYCKIIYHSCKIIYCCDVPYSVNISEGVYFCHNGFGTVINPKSVIGSGTMIQHSVTIGELGEEHSSPCIGSHCFIGARAMVLGGITIGDNVKIGAGAVVLTDIPSNCTAVGVPAKVINKRSNG